MTFLDVQSLGVRYGGIRAVKDIDIQVNEGETVALIGANGAGKTSMLNAIAGLLDHTGDVDFNDMTLTKRPVFERVHCGISLVPEGRGVFGRLTVEENLLMGAYSRKDKKVKSDLEAVYDYFPVLLEKRAQAAGFLSGGQQQMLAIGRALMLAPRLMLLDEPSLGLSPKYVAEIAAIITRLNKERGITVLLVEQTVSLSVISIKAEEIFPIPLVM